MIAIIKYNAGNVGSVQNALKRLGYDAVLTNDASELKRAEKVIFPGVGEASSAMHYLHQMNLVDLIPSLKQPVLGICLGMQLMCAHSYEGDTNGLGIFNNKVELFPPIAKVPHMGWNNFESLNGGLFSGISSEDNMYYVHSYFVEINENTTAICDYIRPFSAALQKNNFYATQFHPEKSADTGEKLLKNFLDL